MLFITAGRLQDLHFPEPKITDPQWSSIAKFSGLRKDDVDARREVQDCVGLYQQLRPDATRKNPLLWKKLQTAWNNERKTLKTLSAIVADPNFLPALAMGLDGQEQIPEKELGSIQPWLEQTCREKQRLVDWYERAIDRLHHRQHGPKKGRNSLFSLVYLLNAILDEYTGVKISRSSNVKKNERNSFEYLCEVCRIAEPTFANLPDGGRSRVDEVAKQVIKEYRSGDDDSFVIGSWEGLIPHYKPATHEVFECRKFGIRVEFHKEGTSSHWSFAGTGTGTTPRKRVRIMISGPELFVPENNRRK